MSLERYINKDSILSISGPRYGQLITQKDLEVMNDVMLIPSDPDLVSQQVSEIHIYSYYGDYVTGNHTANYVWHDKSSNSLLLDVGQAFKDAYIQKGSYVIISNLLSQVWGKFGEEPVLVKEISPDQTEIKFVVDTPYINELQSFRDKVELLTDQDILNNLVVNFGYNRIVKIINVWFETDRTFCVKLYSPVFDEIVALDKGWFCFEPIDPYVDTVILSNPTQQGQTTILPGPNWYLDVNRYTGNSTPYKNWNDVLGANGETNQKIIDSVFSGSNVRLNIDYTDFENFAFYSSALRRIENFYGKMGKIEGYSSSIAILNDSTASITTYISSSIDLNNRRINQIIGNFDPFERWLYYSPTSSIFTHDITGSVTPWPKRFIGSKIINHSVSSSIVASWYDSLKATAIEHDRSNTNRFWWAIPEHIVMDEGNSDFVTFVDMIGHQYDTVYSYIKALTQIHERDEHPQRGFSPDLSWYIAKGYGWHLQNGRQNSDLWKYKLGTDTESNILVTGSLESIPYEGQTQIIWRRIVNNLPYLLKTKGTARSIHAMLNIFGIPKSLISIKEYGGSTDDQIFQDDRYFYGLDFDGSQWIELPRYALPTQSGSWNGDTRVPDSVMFRFITDYSSSLSSSLWAIENGTDRTKLLSNLSIHHVKNDTGNWLYSGSYEYGYLKFTISGSNSTVTSSYLPLYNNDAWSVGIFRADEVSSSIAYYNNEASAQFALGSGSNYYLSDSNTYGLPKGLLFTTPSQSFTYYVNDAAAILDLPTGSLYYLSGSNTYGLPRYAAKRISEYGYIQMFDNVQSARAAGKKSGETFTLTYTNSYAAPGGTEMFIPYDKSFYIKVASTKDCSNGNIVFSSSLLWTGENIDFAWGNNQTGSQPHYVLLGGSTGSNQSRFSGSIQSYKEYFEPLTDQVWKSNVLNPQSYAGNTVSSSYYTLYRYFPLGVDGQKWDHAVYTQVSSSHPNRVASFATTASFKGFIGSESTQYSSKNETLFVSVPTLGGLSPRSKKVRLESSRLITDLNPNSRSDVSTGDQDSFDTNRLAVVFSPTDQLNNDIYNHTGFGELDDFIASPSYEFEEEYSELDRFRHQYFQKYNQRFDLNSFIRIFSIYDYTFFDQIQQLIPGRADYIGGVLVEDDTLNRNKVRISKRPTIQNPTKQTEYNLYVQTASAYLPTYTASKSIETDVEYLYDYHEGSIEISANVEYEYSYVTGSGITIAPTLEQGSTSHYQSGSYLQPWLACFDVIPTRYSGSQTPTGSIIKNNVLNCCYKKVIYHYSASGNFNTKYERDWRTAVSRSYGWYYSRSLDCTSYQYSEECGSTENKRRFGGTQIHGAGINIDSPETINGGPVVSIIVNSEQNIYYIDDPLSGNLRVE